MRPTRPPRRPARLALSVVLLLLAPGLPLRAQETAPDAEAVVRDFNRGFQSYAWDGLAQRIHSDGLAYLRLAVDILVDYDPSGYFLSEIAGEETVQAYRNLADAEVFVRAMRWVQTNAPGLLSSISGRRTEVLGTVVEGEDRHVVYRTIQLAQGAEPELRILTVSLEGDRWRVRRGQDLRSLHTALRGLPRPRSAGSN